MIIILKHDISGNDKGDLTFFARLADITSRGLPMQCVYNILAWLAEAAVLAGAIALMLLATVR
jgi:hypothetical protein